MNTFESNLKLSVIIKIQPDKSRATYLREDAKKRETHMNKSLAVIELDDTNANYYLELTYDIFMSRLRAKMLEDGFTTSGEGAHEAQISYLEVLKFSQKDIQFMDQLRYFRNGIKYYGKSFSAEYAKKAIEYVKRNKERV